MLRARKKKEKQTTEFTSVTYVWSWLRELKELQISYSLAWVSGVSGEKGKHGSENLHSPSPLGRPDTQATYSCNNSESSPKAPYTVMDLLQLSKRA